MGWFGGMWLPRDVKVVLAMFGGVVAAGAVVFSLP